VPLQGASALSAAEADRDAVLPAAAYGPSANEYLVAWVGDQRPLAPGAIQVHVRGTAAGAPTTISTTTPTSSPTGTPTPTATAIATPTPEPSLRDLTLALGGRRVQRALDSGRLKITARCSVTCRLNATARVRVSTRTSFALKRIRATAGPDTRRRMSFTLSRRVRRAVRHALRQGRRVEARSSVRATDALGRSKNKRRIIRLRA
jgi:hypothetical protein